ncbi:uncharacterized protein [Amphiura filiformis]|uniref:uncharacterized protein n=1 Tax=Amphiura filiformis TaxID=82378 RepID=UPI003B211134
MTSTGLVSVSDIQQLTTAGCSSRSSQHQSANEVPGSIHLHNTHQQQLVTPAGLVSVSDTQQLTTADSSSQRQSANEVTGLIKTPAVRQLRTLAGLASEPDPQQLTTAGSSSQHQSANEVTGSINTPAVRQLMTLAGLASVPDTQQLTTAGCSNRSASKSNKYQNLNLKLMEMVLDKRESNSSELKCGAKRKKGDTSKLKCGVKRKKGDTSEFKCGAKRKKGDTSDLKCGTKRKKGDTSELKCGAKMKKVDSSKLKCGAKRKMGDSCELQVEAEKKQVKEIKKKKRRGKGQDKRWGHCKPQKKKKNYKIPFQRRKFGEKRNTKNSQKASIDENKQDGKLNDKCDETLNTGLKRTACCCCSGHKGLGPMATFKDIHVHVALLEKELNITIPYPIDICLLLCRNCRYKIGYIYRVERQLKKVKTVFMNRVKVDMAEMDTDETRLPTKYDECDNEGSADMVGKKPSNAMQNADNRTCTLPEYDIDAPFVGDAVVDNQDDVTEKKVSDGVDTLLSDVEHMLAKYGKVEDSVYADISSDDDEMRMEEDKEGLKLQNMEGVPLMSEDETLATVTRDEIANASSTDVVDSSVTMVHLPSTSTQDNTSVEDEQNGAMKSTRKKEIRKMIQ